MSGEGYLKLTGNLYAPCLVALALAAMKKITYVTPTGKYPPKQFGEKRTQGIQEKLMTFSADEKKCSLELKLETLIC
ncbi:hypothetical protein TIFTF001_038996 [Ficus carica]|uniref:Uncharacterized protein n=1 Tax=Ficus carica TaxID=3494 RepID=A0AA88JEL6_FICCA|nr:hypothetical protein TIFTF001_038996 [Ficus carica]